ncbi:MAG: M56 family metallopeptidase [Enterobacterales bacterium]|nr:M56 family metallopeptidase [Enterobacterales bacterium]
MSFFQWILENAEAVMALLLVNSFYVALLACFVLVLKIIYPKLSCGVEYALWCVVLFRLVLPTNFSLHYSLGYYSHHLFETELPDLLTGSGFWEGWLQGQVFEQSGFSWMVLFVAIWLLAVGLISIKYLALKIKLSKLLNQAHPIEDPWLDKAINQWRREFGVMRQIILIDSDDFLSPFTFGLFSPVIFIPSDLIKEKNPKILEPIIAHEMAHIKRLDAAWLVFQNIVQILYCFNPMVWLIVRRLNGLREEICDQKSAQP